MRIGILGRIGRDASVWNAARPGELGSLCAGINRHGVENERVLRERSSDPS
jgi:hypothetical protein